MSKILFICMIAVLAPFFAEAKSRCPKPTTVKQLVAASRGAEQAFASLNIEQLFKHSTAAREEILPCLGEKLTANDASAFHRLMALEAFSRRNKDRTLREFHAARKLFQGYVLPEDLAGADHPLRKLYTKSEQLSDGDAEEVFPPEKGFVLVGGVRNALRFKDTPVIVQVFDQIGQLIETRYIQPGETLPRWSKKSATVQELGLDTRSSFEKPETWYIAGVVAAVITAGFYGAAMYEKSQFNDTGTPDSDLPGHRDRANGFGYTSVGTGVVAVSMASVGLLFHYVFGDDDAPRAPSMPAASPVAEGIEYGR